LGRIGSAYQKLNDMDNAIKYYGKSLAENRTADILTKLRECEQKKAENEKLAYIDPALSDVRYNI
jgi:stress-induced-phosphoprotein 1